MGIGPRRDPFSGAPPEPGEPTAPHHEDAEHRHAEIVYLGELAADPPNIPDDNVARLWARGGALYGNVAGSTYLLLPLSAPSDATSSGTQTLTTTPTAISSVSLSLEDGTYIVIYKANCEITATGVGDCNFQLRAAGSPQGGQAVVGDPGAATEAEATLVELVTITGGPKTVECYAEKTNAGGTARVNRSRCNIVAFVPGGATVPGAGGGVTDHGALTGLGDDDHPYILDTLIDALGDLIYGSADDTAAKLSGNITTTKKFLTQTGDGAVSAAPGWNVIADADIPATIARDSELHAEVHTHVEADVTDLDHDDLAAIHDDVAGEIAAITEKATPVSADLLLIEDSAAANVKKRVQVGNLPGGGGGGTKIEDADADTKVDVEQGADDDTIRFKTAGTERGTIDSSGALVMSSALFGHGIGGIGTTGQTLRIAPSYTPTVSQFTGLDISPSLTTGGISQTLRALQGTGAVIATGANINNVEGLYYQMAIYAFAGTPTVTNHNAIRILPQKVLAGTMTITDMSGVRQTGSILHSNLTATRFNGLWTEFAGNSQVTTHTQLRISDVTAGTNRYLIWAGPNTPDGTPSVTNLRLDAGQPNNLADANNAESQLYLGFLENGTYATRQVRWRTQSTLGGTDKVLIAV